MECLCSVLSVKPYSGYYPACPKCLRKLKHISSSFNEKSRFSCFSCGTLCTLEQVKWTYCVAMVITDGRSVCDVTSFGPPLNTIFGQSAPLLHRFLQDLFSAPIGLLPSLQSDISLLLLHALKAVLINKVLLFHFRVSTDSMSIKRVPLHDIWLNTKATKTTTNVLASGLIASNITSIMKHDDVTNVLRRLINKENISSAVNLTTRPPYHLDYYQRTHPSFCGSSFNDQLYSSSLNSTSNDHTHLINSDLFSTSVCNNDKHHINTIGNHSNNDDHHAANTIDGNHDNTSREHVDSLRCCGFDLNSLPSQLQRELVNELTATGVSPSKDQATTGDSPLDGELHHLSFVDCDNLLKEIEEEWMMTQTGSHVSIPTQTGSHVSIPTQTGSHVSIPTQTGSHVSIPTQTGSHVSIPTQTGSHVSIPTQTGSHVSIDSPFWQRFPLTQDIIKSSHLDKSATPLSKSLLLNDMATPLSKSSLMDTNVLTRHSDSSIELFGSFEQFNERPLKGFSRNMLGDTPKVRKTINRRKIVNTTPRPLITTLHPLITTPHPIINNRNSFGTPAATSTPCVTRPGGRGKQEIETSRTGIGDNSCLSLQYSGRSIPDQSHNNGYSSPSIL